MSDLGLIVDEFGFNVDFTIIDDETGKVLDLTVFDDIKLIISPTNFGAAVKTLVITPVSPATQGIVRWTVATGDLTLTAGMFFMQINLLDTGSQRRITRRMDLELSRKLA